MKKYVPIHVFSRLILTSIWVFLGVIRWLISLDRNMRSLHLDNFWMEVLLLLIGEAFGEHHGQLVNGAVVNIRGKGDKIAIWMSRYFPLPNIRPDPNCRPVGDQGSKLISDQDLFTDHLGLFQKILIGNHHF